MDGIVEIYLGSYYMTTIGICVKCGKLKEVRQHHFKGYTTDETVSYCRRCDRIAHEEARKKGNCNLNHKEVDHLSKNSYQRRNASIIHLSSETLLPNIEFREDISINKSTDRISFTSYFRGNNGYPLKTINEGKK